MSTLARELAYEMTGLEVVALTGCALVEGDSIGHDTPTLSQFFDAHPRGAVVLWRTAPENGHFTYTVRTAPGRMIYMDSYGIAPGLENRYGAASNGWLHAQSSKNGDWVVDRPTKLIQMPSPLVNTCGRYTVDCARYCQSMFRDSVTPTIARWMASSGLTYNSNGASDIQIVERTRPLLWT